jgi:hypothetical protein
MYIYCVIFIVLAVLAVEYEFKAMTHTNFVLSVLAIFLALFIGLRDIPVSRDYASYLGTFSVVLHGGSNDGAGFLPQFEPGFAFIVMTCYKLFESNQAIAVMLVYGTISIALKIFVFRKISFNPLLVLLFYYSHFFLIQEMTQIRYGMACSLFFLALYYYLEDKKLITLFFILLAILFHNSAILFPLLFLLRKDKLNKWLFGGMFIGAIILGLVRVPLLSLVLPIVDLNTVSSKLTTYADFAEKGYYEKVRFFNVINAMNVLLTASILFQYIKNKIEDERLVIFLKINIFSIFIFGLLIDVPSIATRTSEIFGAVSPLLFAYGAKFFPFGKFNIFILVVVAALYLYVNIFYGKLLNPYDIIQFR